MVDRRERRHHGAGDARGLTHPDQDVRRGPARRTSFRTPAGREVDRLTLALDTIGGSFVTLLKTIVVPLVFLAVVVSVARLREVANAARLASSG